MSPPTSFVPQPSVRLPGVSAKSNATENCSVTAPILSLQTLSLIPSPTTYTITFPIFTTTPFFTPPPSATPSNTVILWFRSDLRLHDHPALIHAINHSQASHVLPLYVFDPRDYGKTPFGFEKTGRYRAKFLIQSVHNLRQSLKRCRSHLVIRVGHPERIIPKLANQISATAVFCHSQISVHGITLESSLQSALHRVGVQFHPMWSSTLYHIDDLPFPIDHLPDIYSTYREQVQINAKIQPPLPPPKTMPRLPQIHPGHIPSLSQLGLTEPRVQPFTSTYTGGEEHALNILSTFLKETCTDRVGYASAEHLGTNFNSRIAPWLALGCVSPRQIYAHLAKAVPKAKQVAIYFDLVWRDLFRVLTVKYNRAKFFTPPTPLPDTTPC